MPTPDTGYPLAILKYDFLGYGVIRIALREYREDFMPNTMSGPPLKLGLGVMNIQRHCYLIEEVGINLIGKRYFGPHEALLKIQDSNGKQLGLQITDLV